MSLSASLTFASTLLLFSVSQPAAATAAAHDLGNVVQVTQYGDTFDITTSSGALVQIQVLTDDIFRIWAGPDGELTDEGSHAAPIVLPHAYPSVTAKATDSSQHYFITTKSFVLSITKSPLLLALYRPEMTKLICRELKPLHLSVDGSYQTLSSGVPFTHIPA